MEGRYYYQIRLAISDNNCSVYNNTSQLDRTPYSDVIQNTINLQILIV